MISSGAVRIFSSHRWAYTNHREGLHNLLAPWIKGVDFVDHSIPKAHPVKVEDDLELARAIQNRIQASDVLVVFAGMYVNFSEWVKLETLCAFFDHCPIIAVVPNGQERVATTATKFADRTVRWRGESIRTAIWELLPEKRRLEILQAKTAQSQNALNGLVPTPRPRPPMKNALAGFGVPNLPPAQHSNYLTRRLSGETTLSDILSSDLLWDLYKKD